MPTAADPLDIAFMHAALGLARRGLGIVWPNPAVGCVIVKDGAVVGRGWTQPGGRPHAETGALGVSWMKIGMLAEANPTLSFNDIVKMQFAAAHVRLADMYPADIGAA